MREVIVETIGIGVRTIQVGRERKSKKMYTVSFVGIICSPRIIPQPGSDTELFRSSRSWKTTKRGMSHAKKNYQKHGERKPSRRRNRWGKARGYIYPSVRILNKSGRCIYPNVV